MEFIIIVVGCFVLYKGIIYYKNKKKQDELKPDFVLKNFTNSSYIAFKGENLYLSNSQILHIF